MNEGVVRMYAIDGRVSIPLGGTMVGKCGPRVNSQGKVITGQGTRRRRHGGSDARS
jgi:hypothetical protein